MRILVTGASGGVGFELMTQLVAEGHDVRAMSRRPLIGDVPPGVESFIGDPTDSSALSGALKNVDGVFINSVFIDKIETAREVSRAVHGSTPSRVVLLSSLCTFTREELALANMLRGAVGEIRSLNPQTTSIHPGEFSSNVLMWREMIKSGSVVHPFGDVRSPVIDPYDIAAVAKVSLTQDGHEGESFKITGIDSISPREQTSVIADVAGREIDYVESSVPQARTQLCQFFDEDHLDYYIAMKGYPKAAECEVLPTVELLTGIRPRSFRTWVVNHRDAFI